MPIYANEKNNDLYFSERGKIDKAQFILDRSGLVLKTCKIPTASLNCKMLRFFSLSFSKAVHEEAKFSVVFSMFEKLSIQYGLTGYFTNYLMI